MLWADDARYQVQAFIGNLTFRGVYDHPVWVLFAYPFGQLPIGEVASRVLCHLAVGGAGGGFHLRRAAPVDRLGMGRGCHSGRARRVPQLSQCTTDRRGLFAQCGHVCHRAVCAAAHHLNRRWFALAGVVLALAVVNHIMMVIGLAGLGGYGLWRIYRERIPVRTWLWGVIGFAATLVLLYLLLRPTLSAAFIPQGERIELSRLPRVALLCGFVYGLQFPARRC